MMRRIDNKLHKEQGFTLIEVIIAVAITAIILTALSSTTMQVITNSQSNYNHMTAIRNLDGASLWFVRDFEAASEYPGNTTLSPNTNNLEITQSLSGGSATVKYFIDNDKNLIRQADSNNTVIGTNITSIEFIPGMGSGTNQLNLTSEVGTVHVSRTVQVKTRIVELDLFLVTTHLPDATKDATYSEQVYATGGKLPLTYEISGGYLPDGLALNAATGILSGQPTMEQECTFTILVTDSDSPQATVSRTFSLSVKKYTALEIKTTSPLPAGNQGVSYSHQLDATGGTEPYTWSILSGSLPPGLSLNPSSGAIIGIPPTPGTYSFTVQVIDQDATPVTKELTIVINIIPPEITAVPATNIGTNSATLNGDLISLGGEANVTLWFMWGTDITKLETTTLATNPSQTMSSPGSFSTNIVSLKKGTVYYFNVKAAGNDGTVVYGANILNFKTASH